MENKKYFIIRKVNCFTTADKTDIIGITTDEKYAKNNQSVFCKYEEVKMIVPNKKTNKKTNNEKK